MGKKQHEQKDPKQAVQSKSKKEINKKSQVIIQKLKDKYQKSITQYLPKTQINNSYSGQDRDITQKIQIQELALQQESASKVKKYQFFFDLDEPQLQFYEEKDESMISAKQTKKLTDQQLKVQREKQAQLKKKRLKALLYVPQRQQFQLTMLNIYEPLLAQYDSTEDIDEQRDDPEVHRILCERYKQQKKNRLTIQDHLIHSDYLTKRNFSGQWQNLQLRQSQYYLSKKQKCSQYTQMLMALKEKYLDQEKKNQQRLKNVAKNMVQLNALFNMAEQANLVMKKNREINQKRNSNNNTEQSLSDQFSQAPLPEIALSHIIDPSLLQRISEQIDIQEQQKRIRQQSSVQKIKREEQQKEGMRKLSFQIEKMHSLETFDDRLLSNQVFGKRIKQSQRQKLG